MTEPAPAETSRAQHLRRAQELLEMEQTRERVAIQLERDGLPANEAAAIVAEAWKKSRGGRRLEGWTEIGRGATIVMAVWSWYEFFARHHLGLLYGYAMVGVFGLGLVSIGSGLRKVLS